MNSLMVPTPSASGEPAIIAVLKQFPEDFVVNENLPLKFDGHGEHLYVQIRKTGINTDEVLKQLELACGVASADIGIAGLKDRHAVTTQWVSVRTPLSELECRERLAQLSVDDKRLEVLQAQRHSRKLRRGAHSGNDFVVTLRSIRDAQADTVQNADTDAMIARVNKRLQTIESTGFPNYVGPQRFGRGGQNIVRARQWFRQPRKRVSRLQRGLWLSAARSTLFNAVCAQRVQAGSWNQLLDGEPAMLDGTRSFFDTRGTCPNELHRRLKSFDIHPSGPQWGRGETLASGDCATFERNALAPFVDLHKGLEKAGLKQERRALRAQARQLTYRWLDSTTLELRFHLLPGIFATTFLNELGICEEPSR